MCHKSSLHISKLKSILQVSDDKTGKANGQPKCLRRPKDLRVFKGSNVCIELISEH